MAGKTARPKSQSAEVADLAAARKVKEGATETGRKQDGAPKNNLQAIREAEQAQLLSVLAKLRPLIAEVEEAKAVVKTRQEAVASMMDHAASVGFKKNEIRDLLKDTAVTGARKNLREAEERRARFREYCGLPVGTQPDLLDRAPEAAMDELDWRGHGYTAGLRGDACDPKAAGVPDRFHQGWMEEWGRGQETSAWSLAPEGMERPKPSGSPAPSPDVGEPHIEPSGDAFEASEAELAAQTSRPSTIEGTDPAPAGDGSAAEAV